MISVLPGSLACLVLLTVAQALDPSRAAGRLLEVGATVLVFSLTRMNMGEGSPRGAVGFTALARGAARFVSGAEMSHAVVAALGGGFYAVLLVLVDLFTLRRDDARRLYNFLFVLGLAAPGWFLLAVWLPHVAFPRPPLLPSLAAELCGGLATGLACFLAAPRVRVPVSTPVKDPPADRQAARERARELLPGLELGIGASGAPFAGGEGSLAGEDAQGSPTPDVEDPESGRG